MKGQRSDWRLAIGLRVDQGLAVEAHVGGLAAGIFKACIVVEVEMHAVEHHQAIGAADEQAPAETRQHRQALAGMAGMRALWSDRTCP